MCTTVRGLHLHRIFQSNYQPDHAVWHVHVLSDSAHRMTTHVVDRHAGTSVNLTKMFRGAEYFSFGGGDIR